MKKFLFLFAIFGLLFCYQEVHARSFYGGPWIPDIYLNRDKGSAHIYQQAQVIRRLSDNQVSYCLEPFKFLNDGNGYTADQFENHSISKEVWEKITLLAYFGYSRQNHDDEKWYPITQMLIWKEIDPAGDYYFTDTFNGNRISKFEDEIKELEGFIEKYKKGLSFDNQEVTVTINQKLTLNDKNNNLEDYYLYGDDKSISKNGNNLTITGDTIGEKVVNLIDYNYYDYSQPILYFHPTSQKLMVVGDIPNKKASIKVNIIDTSITVMKEDFDKGLNSSGEALLNGTVIGLFDSDYKKISEKTVVDNKVVFEHIPVGTYYISEITPGIGYNIDKEFYQIVINKDHRDEKKTIYNKVKKGTLIIHKTISKNNLIENEALVNFAIYDKDNKLIDTITTDKNGLVSLDLPYGTYRVEQLNTKDEYKKVEDFTITIKDDKQILSFDLIDYFIEVPNTFSYGFTINLEKNYYVKKKYFN